MLVVSTRSPLEETAMVERTEMDSLYSISQREADYVALTKFHMSMAKFHSPHHSLTRDIYIYISSEEEQYYYTRTKLKNFYFAKNYV